MNDLINQVLLRYDSFKKGDRTASAEINPAWISCNSREVRRFTHEMCLPCRFNVKGTSGTAARTKAKAAPAPNLIDFDDPVPSSSSVTSNGASASDIFDFEGLSLGNSAVPTPPSGRSGNDLFSGLSFAHPPSASSQPPTPAHSFYQQYQSQVPAQKQQQAVSWGNLNSVQSSKPLMGGSNGTAKFSSLAPASPSLMLASDGTSSYTGNVPAMRPTTPGAISLGMMGSLPGTPTGVGGGLGQASASPSIFAVQSPAQPPKKKDPFEDLLMWSMIEMQCWPQASKSSILSSVVG